MRAVINRMKQAQLLMNKTATLDQAGEKGREEAKKKKADKEAVSVVAAKAQEKENTMD